MLYTSTDIKYFLLVESSSRVFAYPIVELDTVGDAVMAITIASVGDFTEVVLFDTEVEAERVSSIVSKYYGGDKVHIHPMVITKTWSVD